MKPVLPLAALGVAMLGGCATPSLSQLQADNAALRAARSAIVIPADPPAAAPDTVVPLDADGAARLALTRHPAARALLAQLQFAQADLYEALRPGNPVLDLGRLETPGGLVHNAWSVSQPLLDLLFAGYRRRHGELALHEAQRRVADALLRLERDARQAWVAHAAAAQRLAVARQAEQAGMLAAELAARYHEAGNIAEAQWRAEQAAAREASLERGAREAAWIAARRRLLDAIGVSGHAAALQFDARLPLPVAFAPDAAALTEVALAQRLDLAAQQAALERAHVELRQQRRWRWLPQAAVRIEAERGTGEAWQRGPGLELGLPFPDSGAGRVARAQATLTVREAELDGQRSALRNAIEADVAALAVAHRGVEDDARALRELNQRLVALARLEYNFMFIGSFELLAARRRQIEGEWRRIDAVERWWQAFNDLTYEAGGRLPAGPITDHIAAEVQP